MAILTSLPVYVGQIVLEPRGTHLYREWLLSHYNSVEEPCDKDCHALKASDTSAAAEFVEFGMVKV